VQLKRKRKDVLATENVDVSEVKICVLGWVLLCFDVLYTMKMLLCVFYCVVLRFLFYFTVLYGMVLYQNVIVNFVRYKYAFIMLQYITLSYRISLSYLSLVLP
jgi:hypothetical protein